MIGLVVGLLVFQSFLTGDDISFRYKENEDPEQLISRANNEFSFKIFKMLSKEDNDVMSSLSMLSAFTILMNGVNGQTLTDLKRFLHYNKRLQYSKEGKINVGFQTILDNNGKDGDLMANDEERYKLSISNKVIHSDRVQLLPKFTDTVRQYFKCEVQSADFMNNGEEETNKLNVWVHNQTNGKISKVFDRIAPDTSALIINVLYFKAIWDEPFPQDWTRKLDFYNNGVTPVKVDTMNHEFRFSYAESSELDSQLLELDYRGRELSFVVVLPKERNGLKSLIQKINAHNFDTALKSLHRSRDVDVYLPKFKIEKSYNLMKDINPKPIALTDRADLSRMTVQPSKVDEVIHKVFIEVNERQTEAAAVSIVRVALMSSAPPKKYTFRADHPFLYFIRDKRNGLILFSGQINKL